MTALPTATPASDPYRQLASDVSAALSVDPAVGLSEEEVGSRLALYGPNQLAEAARRPALLRFADQFRSVLILVLIAAAVLAGVVGDVKDTIVITVVLLINATIGFVMENRAERSLDALRDMLSPTARVRRSGRTAEIDASELVPGDLVLLEAGDRVPADGRLLVAQSVEVDESALTGESQPVVKGTAAVGADGGTEVPLAERTDMAYMNTTLTRGRAELVVTATGMATAVGGIAGMLARSTEPASPLQMQIDSVGKRIALIGGIAVALYAGLAFARGESPAEVALSAVALAVATVPEGLPAVLALTLALGVARMAKQGAIVKRLASVETLGSATVVCSDKTGTLTLNQMTAREVAARGCHYRVEGEGYQSAGEIVDVDSGRRGLAAAVVIPFALCSDAVVAASEPDREVAGIVGDPTEGALVVLAAKAGIDVERLRREHRRVGEVPFDSARKWMATLHAEQTRVRVYAKGAPDVLLARCSHLDGLDGPIPLDEAARSAVLADIATFASRGLRVLAAATTLLDDVPAESDALVDTLTGLTFVGIVGIADPPRPEAREAVARCHRAGIAVKMITGDHRDTAAAIAGELGIPGDVVTGADLDRMGEAALRERISDIGVFARVAPEHKVMIIEALTRTGQVAAMTGDGVNDAAALRTAHIGVAMGITGTEVTKEAGAMILADDNFATIVGAVREGRAIYDNVVKFIRFQLSTNIGAILSFLGAAVAGLPAPLAAIQVLWVNIIMDGPPAIALGVDPARPGLMGGPPRPSGERILNLRRLGRIFRAGLVMAAGTLGLLAWARGEWSQEAALTMAFTTFVLFQFFNALNARTESTTVFRRQTFTNRWLWISFGAVVALQVAIVQIPLLGVVFGTVPLDTGQWLLCLAVAATVLIVEELVKLVARLARRSR
ncbi:MAG TPA: HAD-IC family P-type ATPase [Mycobacterium sp.]|nr:HAD-IC family P-type ATPase [Mycobacterium sp.]